jgi:hypothetical protein
MSGAMHGPTPAERLRALELSGDPKAIEMARSYSASPSDFIKPMVREAARTMTRLLRPSIIAAISLGIAAAALPVALS